MEIRRNGPFGAHRSGARCAPRDCTTSPHGGRCGVRVHCIWCAHQSARVSRTDLEKPPAQVGPASVTEVSRVESAGWWPGLWR